MIAGVVGLMALSGVRVINAKPVGSAWLLLGLLPAAVGSYFQFVA